MRVRGQRVTLGLLAVVLTAGCSVGVTGTPSAEDTSSGPSGSASSTSGPSASGPSASGSSTAGPPATAPLPVSGNTCGVMVRGPGSVVVTGAQTRSRTVNGVLSLSCHRLPLVTVTTVDRGGVTFAADGAVTTVAVGASDRVGDYVVTVHEATADGTARFDMAG